MFRVPQAGETVWFKDYCEMIRSGTVLGATRSTVCLTAGTRMLTLPRAEVYRTERDALAIHSQQLGHRIAMLQEIHGRSLHRLAELAQAPGPAELVDPF